MPIRLYVSLFILLAVILYVPFGLAGSFVFAQLWGLENNIYVQTCPIMLIGLPTKTTILLTEYASDRRRLGIEFRRRSHVGRVDFRFAVRYRLLNPGTAFRPVA